MKLSEILREVLLVVVISIEIDNLFCFNLTNKKSIIYDK